jgi:hypothetical protein
MFSVIVFFFGTIITYLFAFYRVRLNIQLVNRLHSDFPQMVSSIDDVMERHCGIFRIVLLSVAVSASIVVGAGLVQDSSLWWDAPLVHIPLGFVHLATVFFVAAYFLLRSLAVNKAMRLALEGSDPPPIAWSRVD